MIYYAIKNNQTQMYYRGKGVNKWGKYYNQASIYRVKGMVEESLDELTRRGEDVKIIPIHIFEEEYGHWVKPTEFSDYSCSNCGMSPHMAFGTLPDYCPHCGRRNIK